MAVPNITSGILTAFISDNLTHFLVVPNIFFNSSYTKSNNYEKDWSRFDQKNFVLEYFSVSLDNIMLSSDTNTKKFYKNFLEKFESLFETYSPLKKIYKNKLKFKDTSWTTHLQKSLSIKTNFCQNLCKNEAYI